MQTLIFFTIQILKRSKNMGSTEILTNLKGTFLGNPFTEISFRHEFLFTYESVEINHAGSIIRKFTEMTNSLPSNRHFKSRNINIESQTIHICIDGDFIEYGQENYDPFSASFSQGRPDSLIFNDQTFLFLELKVEQEAATVSKEDPKWKKYFDGANQILDFVNFLRANNFEVNSLQYNIYGVVCFRFEPDFSIISNGNAQRNSQLLKISQKLGFMLVAHNHELIFEM
jgi:hypothetical protein